jgi:hypothetical protein
MWHVIKMGLMFGLGREVLLRKVWIPPEPGTKEERRKYTERIVILSVLYSAISLFVLFSWLR